MKKNLVIVCVSVLILSMFMVSAFSWNDLFPKQMTGEVTIEIGDVEVTETCYSECLKDRCQQSIKFFRVRCMERQFIMNSCEKQCLEESEDGSEEGDLNQIEILGGDIIFSEGDSIVEGIEILPDDCEEEDDTCIRKVEFQYEVDESWKTMRNSNEWDNKIIVEDKNNDGEILLKKNKYRFCMYLEDNLNSCNTLGARVDFFRNLNKEAASADPFLNSCKTSRWSSNEPTNTRWCYYPEHTLTLRKKSKNYIQSRFVIDDGDEVDWKIYFEFKPAEVGGVEVPAEVGGVNIPVKCGFCEYNQDDGWYLEKVITPYKKCENYYSGNSDMDKLVGEKTVGGIKTGSEVGEVKTGGSNVGGLETGSEVAGIKTESSVGGIKTESEVAGIKTCIDNCLEDLCEDKVFKNFCKNRIKNKQTCQEVCENPSNNFNCIDSDNGIDYFNYGYSEGDKEGAEGYGKYYDSCADNVGETGKISGAWIAETHCSGPDEEPYVHTQWYQCSNGCENGKCI